MVTRAERRHRSDLAKAESRTKLRRTFQQEPTPRQVGIQAVMHNTCPCGMCTTKEKLPTRTFLSDLTKLHAYQ